MGDGEDSTELIASVVAVLGSWAETLMICRSVRGNTSQLDVANMFDTIILAVAPTLSVCPTLLRYGSF